MKGGWAAMWLGCLLCYHAVPSSAQTVACVDFIGSEDVDTNNELKCASSNCEALGNGVVNRIEPAAGGLIQEVCDDWGNFNRIGGDSEDVGSDVDDGGRCFFKTEDASTFVNWNLDIDGLEDGCYDNGTIASETHMCFQLPCADYSISEINTVNATKIDEVSAVWQAPLSAFQADYNTWTNIATACDSNNLVGYNEIVNYYTATPQLTQAQVYEAAISQLTTCFSCGNGIRQVVNGSTLDLNFFFRYYQLGSDFTDLGGTVGQSDLNIDPTTFAVDFVEQCDDGNFISGDGCSGCNFKKNRLGDIRPDDPNDHSPGAFGLPFPWACSCTPGTYGTYFCAQQACQVEEGFVCREDDTKLSVCKETICGNGYVQHETGEECDDGNLIDGDGCSSTCTLELGYDCTEVENANGRWRSADYFRESVEQAKTVCALLPRYETPESEVEFLIEWYNETTKVQDWAISTGWAEALDAAGNVRDIKCTVLTELFDPNSFVSCNTICNKTQSNFTCETLDTLVLAFNFTKSCYETNTTIMTQLRNEIASNFGLPDLTISNFDYSIEENQDLAQFYFFERGVLLRDHWFQFDNATGNQTLVFLLNSLQFTQSIADDIVNFTAGNSFLDTLWRNSITPLDLDCVENIPTAVVEANPLTCTDANITYEIYHEEWCNNCCASNISQFQNSTDFGYYEHCDEYEYLVTIEAADMEACWDGRELGSTECTTDVCIDNLGDPIDSDYCSLFNLYKHYCGRPFDDTATTPIFVVEYLLSDDPCGKCRSDEVCDVWYGLTCDFCDGCGTLDDANEGICPCNGEFAEGVFETSGEVHVTNINLRDNTVGGTVIKQLDQLVFLEEFFMNENDVTGFDETIDWSALDVLRRMYFSTNALIDSLPLGFKFLSAIEEMYFDHNSLTSVDDATFSDDACCGLEGCAGTCASALSVLDVSFNALSGSVPASLSHLPNLQTLDMSDNALTSFGTFKLSDSLQFVDFRRNQITDSFTTLDRRGFFDSDLTILRSLLLGGNQLTGSLPGSLSAMTNLRALSLASNSISGFLPPAIGSLTALTSLDLSGNALALTISTRINQLSNLIALNFANNKIEGLPVILDGLRQLTSMRLNGNRFRTVPDLTDLTELRILDISSNLIGSLPLTLRLNDKLAELYVQSNLLSSAAALPVFSDMDNLETLDLSHNQLAGELSDNLDVSSLRTLRLNDNQISGSLSNSITAAEDLVELYLSNNQLIGLPNNFARLSNLQVIDVSNNLLATTIPPTMGLMSSILSINMRNNSLIGDIPASFASLDTLEYLDLSLNNLDGTIPTELGSSLASLTLIDIQDNFLTGSLPAELLTLPSVKTLRLGGEVRGNQLTGFLPDGICDLTGLDEFSIRFSGIFWCPLPCSAAPIDSSTQCLNCPGDPSTTCFGGDESCVTCSNRGQCDFGSVISPSTSGTCASDLTIFEGENLETLSCPNSCSGHGTCQNTEVFVQCPCVDTLTPCAFDITSSFYAGSHPTILLDAVATRVANYSLDQNPNSGLTVPLYDPTISRATPPCQLCSSRDSDSCTSCFQNVGGVWQATGECADVKMLFAHCDCDEDYRGDSCQTFVTQVETEASVFISPAPGFSTGGVMAALLITLFSLWYWPL